LELHGPTTFRDAEVVTLVLAIGREEESRRGIREKEEQRGGRAGREEAIKKSTFSLLQA
jgi:hypothetical protein